MHACNTVPCVATPTVANGCVMICYLLMQDEGENVAAGCLPAGAEIVFVLERGNPDYGWRSKLHKLRPGCFHILTVDTLVKEEVSLGSVLGQRIAELRSTRPEQPLPAEVTTQLLATAIGAIRSRRFKLFFIEQFPTSY